MRGRTVAVVACAIGALAAAPSVINAMWGLFPPPEKLARVSELVVRGRMVAYQRECVRFKGRLFGKRVGTIRVDEVLLAPKDYVVPDEIEAHWGNLVGMSCPLILIDKGMDESGIWLLRRHGPDGAFTLAGPESAVFVREADVSEFKKKIAQEPPVGILMTRRGSSVILTVRYLNLTDEPRDATRWSLANDELQLPAPLALTVDSWRWQEEERQVTIKATSATLPDAARASVRVPPRSYVAEEIDVTGWIGEFDSAHEMTRYRLRVGDDGDLFDTVHEDLLSWIGRSEDGDDDHSLYLQGDWGTRVWWMPSASCAYWTALLVCPILAAGAYVLWTKQKKDIAVVVGGVALGLGWSWLLLRLGPGAWLGALMASDGVPGGSWIGAALLLLLLSVLPLSVFRLLGRKFEMPVQARAAALGAWLGLPLVCGLIVGFTQGFTALI